MARGVKVKSMLRTAMHRNFSHLDEDDDEEDRIQFPAVKTDVQISAMHQPTAALNQGPYRE